jgi:hypothetical protein
MSTDNHSAKTTAPFEERQAWNKPMLRSVGAREAETGIFLGPELIVQLS